MTKKQTTVIVKKIVEWRSVMIVYMIATTITVIYLMLRVQRLERRIDALSRT